MPGTKADCASYLCCREEYGMAGEGEAAAGEWGSNAGGLCDIPPKTFAHLLNYIVSDI